MKLKLRVSMASSPLSLYQYYSLVQQCGGDFEAVAQHIDLTWKPVRERVQNETGVFGARVLWEDK
jgi:hypothetical protein